jgi:hypothetical protein
MIKICTFVNGWNDGCRPFLWTKTADQIPTQANRRTTSVAVTWMEPALYSESKQ